MKTKLVAVLAATLLAVMSGVFAQGGAGGAGAGGAGAAGAGAGGAGAASGSAAVGTGTGVPANDGSGRGAPVGAATQQSQPAQAIHAPGTGLTK